jgi:transposase InsO family protein
MPKTRPAYPERFRREALELVRQGRSIPDVARPDAADRAWGADIKQIRTGEGWLYLAAVQDLFSRRIVGWAMEAHMRTELVVAILEMAVSRRRPAKGTIHHSDHGG